MRQAAEGSHSLAGRPEYVAPTTSHDQGVCAGIGLNLFFRRSWFCALELHLVPPVTVFGQRLFDLLLVTPAGKERVFFINSLQARIHFITEMVQRTVAARHGSLNFIFLVALYISTFLGRSLLLPWIVGGTLRVLIPAPFSGHLQSGRVQSVTRHTPCLVAAGVQQRVYEREEAREAERVSASLHTACNGPGSILSILGGLSLSMSFV